MFDIKTTLLSGRHLNTHSELFLANLHQRYQVFTIENRWFPEREDGLEFDQYDTPEAYHLIFSQGTEVVGGMRFLPTTHRVGKYSYMIRDAKLGLLHTLPKTLLWRDAPIADGVWECTRFFMSARFRNAADNHSLARIMSVQMVQAAHDLQIKQLLVLTWAAWPVLYRRFKVEATEMGPLFQTPEETTHQCALIDVQASFNRQHCMAA